MGTCCQGGIHQFSPRFSTVPPTTELIEQAGETCCEGLDVGELIRVIAALSESTYVCDVCEKCGITAGVPAS